jgi:hypothetical protein
MKNLMSLFLAGAFMVSVPAFANEEFSLQDNEEGMAILDTQQLDFNATVDSYRRGDGRGGDRWGDHRGDGRRGGDRGRDRGGDGWRDGRRGCPIGYRREPSYRWDRRAHRWVHVGWTCRPYGGYNVDSEEVTQ